MVKDLSVSAEELKANGVNLEALKYPYGEMNIIVQCFGTLDGMEEEYDEDLETEVKHPITELLPDIYQPRRNRVWSCGCSGDSVAFETDEDKKDWVLHLRDSAERLKIMSYILSKQANEIEEFGYPKTSLYYPEPKM